MSDSPKFVHLHVHTSYSLLDGISFREDLLKKAKEYGMPALAVTDHGALYNHVSFYQAAAKEGVKPILGMEAYMAPDSRHNRKYEAKKDLEKGDISAHSYHLILLAKNAQGYKNLIKLSTLAHREGFYYKPRIDLEILNQYREGLIVTSACVGSIIAQGILQDRKDLAEEWIDKFRYMFGENFYLELMKHDMPEDKIVSEALIDFGKRKGIGLIITNDSHFTNREDATAQEVALCLASKKTLNDPDHWRFPGQGYWFKSAEEMAATIGEAGYPEECFFNTVRIAEQVEDYAFRLATAHGHMVPLFRDRAGTQWTSEESHQNLVLRAWDGLIARGLSGKPEYEQRLEVELDTMQRKNFSSYFLIIADIIDYIRTLKTIPPFGRGSSVGSLVCYCLGITAMDPIRWHVPFYRFINEGRKDLPDIDTDISKRHRQKVIRYIVKTYGEDRVAQIATFQTMAAKKAIDDAGAALDVPPTVRRQVTKLLGETVKDDVLEELLAANSEALNLLRAHPGWLDIAKTLEGVHRNLGLHAAGVVICNEPLDNYVPLGRDNEGYRTTQYDMIDVQALGLLKLDMLGLRAIDTIYDTMQMVKEIRGIDIDVYNLPLDDQRTYRTIYQGEFVSIFQYDSQGMRNMARKLIPDSFELLMALNALFRPGPMEPQKEIGPDGQEIVKPSIADTFLERRHGREKVDVWHPSLDVILKDTFGMPLYQEQISEMSKAIAGFNDTEADEYRAAIGKKNKEKFDKAQKKFKEYGMSRGHPEAFMDFLVSALTGFARYGWNRGHSAGYSYISYATAYFETHYPVEYYTALLNTNLDKADQLTVLLGAIMQKGIEIKPPDINTSGPWFSTDGKHIYMGLLSVRMMGIEALTGILWERERNGKFESYLDFVRRVCNISPIPTNHDIFVEHKLPEWNHEKNPEIPVEYAIKSVTKTVIENLVKAGSFTWDEMFTDKDKIAIVEKVQKIIKKKKFNIDEYALTVYAETEEIRKGEEYSKLERSAMEREVLNFYVSGHPVTAYAKYIPLLHTEGRLVTPSQVKQCDIDSAIIILGLLQKKEMKMTKNNKPFVVLRLQDQFGEYSVRVWDPLATAIWPTLVEGAITVVRGTTQEPFFEGGGVDVYVKSVASVANGLPIRGYVVDSPEKIDTVTSKLRVTPVQKADIPGYGIVCHLDRAYGLKPDDLDLFMGMEGLKLALSV
jgi:DNA polymerase-3 subunit alpha